MRDNERLLIKALTADDPIVLRANKLFPLWKENGIAMEARNYYILGALEQRNITDRVYHGS